LNAATRGEAETIERFLSEPTEENYAALFRVIAPQVIAFLRVRGCEPALAEDISQEIMLTVYRKSADLRDRDLFRAWLFRIARNALLQHRRQKDRQVPTEDIEPRLRNCAEAPDDRLLAFQFNEWMSALNPDERQIMTLRFVEGLEYHEIASVLSLPLGTVQWKIFHSKRKLVAQFGVTQGEHNARHQ
jgi:RNA polymerase sigma factor (sigma-70 family)